MKKLMYTSIICLGLLLFGQTAANAQVNIGLRGSINIADISGTRISTESVTGYAVGAYASIRIPNSPIGIQQEILYTQKGFTSSSELEDQDAETTFELDYIEIPLLAKISLGSYGTVAPYIYGGTYLGLKIYADAESNSPQVEIDNFNSTDYGYIVGAGINIGRFNIDARYESGLAEISDNSDAKNSVVTIAAGIELF